MAFGTPYTIGQAQSAVSTTTYSVPVTATTAAHDSICVAAAGTSVTQATACADSRGNTYVLQSTSGASTTGSLAVFTCANAAVPLVSGTDTLTVTWSAANTNSKSFWVVGVSGGAAIDVVPAATSSTGTTTPSISSGAMAAAGDIVFAFFNTGNAGGTPSGMSGGFTSLGTYQFVSNMYLTAGWLVASSAASVTCTVTIVSAKYVAEMVTQLPAPPAGVPELAMAPMTGA